MGSFTGPQAKGAKAALKIEKRREAEERNAKDQGDEA